MPISIEVSPVTDFLDMYGEPDTLSAYSLSGHVSIAVASPYSLFERRKTARLILHSVTLTFEGQTEIITPQIGYSSLRLCSISRELLPDKQVELSNEGHEESNEPCVWHVVFDLPVPGWLPASLNYGAENVGTKYALYATAKFVNLDNNHTHSWSLATLCSPFRSRMKTVDACKCITLRRFSSPPSFETTSPPLLNYLVSPKPPCNTGIPSDVLSKIQVLVSVSEHVNINDNATPLTIRMRAKDLDASECKRLQVTTVAFDVTQNERCRYTASPEYMTQYLLPPISQQPPNEPLRDPHPISTIYDLGLYVACYDDATSRSFSLLPSSETGVHTLVEKNVFVNDASPSDESTWYTLQTSVPFSQYSLDDTASEWAGSPEIRPTASSPLLSVSHDITISITCIYDLQDCERQASERLTFTIPICFTPVTPTLPQPNILVSALIHGGTSTARSLPYAPTLPAYSQLFDSNGDRKIDYSVPLPLYTSSSPASSSSSTLDLDVEQKVPSDTIGCHDHEFLFSSSLH